MNLAAGTIARSIAPADVNRQAITFAICATPPSRPIVSARDANVTRISSNEAF